MTRVVTIARRRSRAQASALFAGVLALLYVAASGLALAHDHAGEGARADGCSVCRVAHAAAVLPAAPLLAALQACEAIEPTPCRRVVVAALGTIRVRGPPSVDRTA